MQPILAIASGPRGSWHSRVSVVTSGRWGVCFAVQNGASCPDLFSGWSYRGGERCWWEVGGSNFAPLFCPLWGQPGV